MTPIRGTRLSSVLAWLLAIVVMAGAVLVPARAQSLGPKPIDLNHEGDRIDLAMHGVPIEARGDQLQTDTAIGADGTAGRMAVRAVTPGTSPNWFVFALRNTTDKPMERWFVADRYSLWSSGIVWPDLDARRVENITPSLGFVPERLPFDGADAFRLTLEAGQIVTFVAELNGDRLPRLQLWTPLEFEKRSRNRQLFHGILLGVVGLLATFLTAVFAANHKAIFPSAALFTWCVLAYLCVDFGFWHKLFNVRPEENAQYRAAAEAAMAATLLIFVHTFLRLGRWHGFMRMLLGLWLAAQLVLVGLAFLDPRLAATFARLSTLPILGICGLIILYFGVRGQDRALSIVPTWILFGVWVFAAGLIVTGRLAGDVPVNALVTGLVLLVVLIGFTVTQYAFRAVEPLYGLEPDEQNLRGFAIEGAGAAVFEWNARRDEVKLGPMVEAALGRDSSERHEPTQKFIAGLHPADRERFQQLLAGLKAHGGGEVNFDFRLRHSDNSYRWFKLEGSVLAATDRRIVRCVGLLREVTNSKRANERLMHDAVHDSLTGTPNRALFLDRLTVAMTRAKSEPALRPLIVFIDLDRFKSVNSSFGHLVGDSLLITLARRLQRLLGPSDSLGRLGGDQFGMIFLSTRDASQKRALCEEIRAAIKGVINIGGQDIVLTGAIGAVEYAGVTQAAHELLGDAEVAMYRAKRIGPDQIEWFQPAMRVDKDDRVAIESDLRQAIEKKQLKVLFQPIMYLRTEELAGFEALVRWDHPRHGMLNPSEFVPLAEDSDLIVRLGSYVLQVAVAEAQRWQKALERPHRPPLYVSVNVSSRQLFRQEIVAEVHHIIGRGVLPKGALRLEITESLAMENPEQATKVLEALSQAGAGLAIDDFGAGYSSLCYLNTFPVDTIKIDRALVHMADKGGTSSAVLRSVVALAHELGKSVVAEGVEVEDEVGLLRSIGCEFAQGYYYGEAVDAADVMKILKRVQKNERRLKRGGLFRLRNRRRNEETATEPVSTDNETVAVAAAKDAKPRSTGGAVPRPRTTAMPPPSNPTRPVQSPALAHARLRGSPTPMPAPMPQSPISAPAPSMPPRWPTPAAAPALSPPPRMPPPVAPLPPSAAAAGVDSSLSRLQAELARPSPRSVQPPLHPVTHSGRPSSEPAASNAKLGTPTAAPPPTVTAMPPSPPALTPLEQANALPPSLTRVTRPTAPPPNLDQLPPAIAASLARLSGSKGGAAPPLPTAGGKTAGKTAERK